MSLLFIDGICEHFVPSAKQLFIEAVAIFARLSLESLLPILKHLVLFIFFFAFGSQLLGINFLARGYLFCSLLVFFSAVLPGTKLSGGRYI